MDYKYTIMFLLFLDLGITTFQCRVNSWRRGLLNKTTTCETLSTGVDQRDDCVLSKSIITPFSASIMQDIGTRSRGTFVFLILSENAFSLLAGLSCMTVAVFTHTHKHTASYFWDLAVELSVFWRTLVPWEQSLLHTLSFLITWKNKMTTPCKVCKTFYFR